MGLIMANNEVKTNNICSKKRLYLLIKFELDNTQFSLIEIQPDILVDYSKDVALACALELTALMNFLSYAHS